MKNKFIIIAVVLILVSSLPLAAERHGDTEQKSKIGLDFGGFVTTGWFPQEPASLLFLLRGGSSVTVRYRINDTFSFGIEAGISAFYYDTGSSMMFLDAPVRAVFRIGGGKTFLEPHAGYYFTILGSDLDGFSFGAKASLSNLYVDFSYILGSDYSYPRFGLGYQLNNIF